MDPFTIDVSNPFPSGCTGGIGGPGEGGHVSPDWYIQYGMDLGAPVGTVVHAAFDAHVTRMTPHDPAADTTKVYGAQLFMRSMNDGMGAFYTHVTATPPGVQVGSKVHRGDSLGTVFARAGMASHLHLALVEIVGGLPGGSYTGVDLYELFLRTANTTTVTHVTFNQSGAPPTLALGDDLPLEPLDLGTIRGIQNALALLGFDPGPVDGNDSALVHAAVAAFQLATGIAPDGVVDDGTAAALGSALSQIGVAVG